MVAYHRGHENFYQRLSASHAAVELVARWQITRGHSVFVAVDSDGPDGGDLVYTANGRLILADVKHKQIDFSSREDYPYRDLWVCQAHQFDDKNPKPDVYILLNRHMTHAAIAMSAMSCDWEKRVEKHPNNKSGKSVSYFTKDYLVVEVPQNVKEEAA